MRRLRVKKRKPGIQRRKRKKGLLGGKRRTLKKKPISKVIGLTYENGFDNGHTEGFRKGYDSGVQEGGGASASASLINEQEEGFKAGYKKGLEVGKYDGGDSIIDRSLPGQYILPDTSIEQIIAAGITAMEHRLVQLLSVEQVGERILLALEERSPLSVVRLGDGELLTLAQETVMTVEQIKQEGDFLPYAGVLVPDLVIRDQLLEAVKRAGIVGIPVLRQKNYQSLAAAVFQAYGMDFRSRKYTDSLVNYSLYKSGYLWRMIQGSRVLLIGNLAEDLATIWRAQGVNVVGVITPVHGVGDATRISNRAQQYDFDLAIVSAGISAVLIVEEIARVMGKVALDFGHMADSIIKGEASFL